MKVWVVVATSCQGCNSLAVQVLDHVPDEGNIAAVKDEAGGMWCISTRTLEVEVNAEPQETEIYPN